METVLETVGTWRAEGIACALARVVATGGSAPLAVGTAMAVSASGAVVGGVSGGCVDAAVYSLCLKVLEEGGPASAVFGPDGDDLLAVAPTCGGRLEVFVEPIPATAHHPLDRVTEAVREGRPVRAVTVLDGPRAGEWAVGDDDEVSQWARGPITAAEAGTATVPATVEGVPARVVVQSMVAPRLLVFGATAFAEALVPIGAQLGYRVTVCDARPVFAIAERFPAAEQVVRCWPHEFLRRTRVDPSTAICVLTHDPKFDVPLLVEALRSPAGYIGAMGSRRTHVERSAQLRAEGVSEPQLSRLSSPIGLDLGARTATETALSIAAELVAHRRGGTGARLVGIGTDIHRPAREASPSLHPQGKTHAY